MFMTYTKVNDGHKSTIFSLGQVDILQVGSRPKTTHLVVHSNGLET